jgi:hypothetical protein
MRFLKIIFGLILIQSCTMKAPLGFSFTIEGDVDRIDSKNHILKRSYMFKDTTVNLEFSEDDLSFIYKKYRKFGIDKLPADYEPKCKIGIIPTFFETITITINGEKRRLVFNSDYNCENEIDRERVKHIGLFIEDIMKIVISKKEYRNLKETDLIFL